ncbi:MAG: hypothetical protein KDD62_09090, partial [Bdellovibrionales bacterium]|nr:hypothetical protein [Bdellovibrionales bacterium]
MLTQGSAQVVEEHEHASDENHAPLPSVVREDAYLTPSESSTVMDELSSTNTSAVVSEESTEDLTTGEITSSPSSSDASPAFRLSSEISSGLARPEVSLEMSLRMPNGHEQSFNLRDENQLKAIKEVLLQVYPEGERAQELFAEIRAKLDLIDERHRIAQYNQSLEEILGAFNSAIENELSPEQKQEILREAFSISDITSIPSNG